MRRNIRFVPQPGRDRVLTIRAAQGDRRLMSRVYQRRLTLTKRLRRARTRALP
jgi:hypothetical protein